MSNRLFAAGVAFMFLAGCATDPIPAEQIRLTEQAVAQAKAVGAVEQMDELVLAETKLADAQSAIADEDYKRARVLAEQAELDARLAEARVLTSKSEAQLADLHGKLNRLRKQLGEQQ
nr:DUF4398 domain-containing protein [Pseudomonas kuykendallii]